jgi:hypothetical protein
MDGWQAVYDLRERTVAALEQAAAGRLDPASAAVLLSDLRASWSREKRWRNNALPVQLLHVAGPVIDSRRYVRSCPRFIVERRQACTVCGAELIRGRWAVFFADGQVVAAMPGRRPILNAATLDTPGLPCATAARMHAVVVTKAPRGAPPYGWTVVDGELRPLEGEQAVLAKLRELRDAGLSYRQLVEHLDSAGIPARRGGRWHPMTVRGALSRHAVTDEVPQPPDKAAYLSAQEMPDEGGVKMENETP